MPNIVKDTAGGSRLHHQNHMTKPIANSRKDQQPAAGSLSSQSQQYSYNPHRSIMTNTNQQISTITPWAQPKPYNNDR